MDLYVRSLLYDQNGGESCPKPVSLSSPSGENYDYRMDDGEVWKYRVRESRSSHVRRQKYVGLSPVLFSGGNPGLLQPFRISDGICMVRLPVKLLWAARGNMLGARSTVPRVHTSARAGVGEKVVCNDSRAVVCGVCLPMGGWTGRAGGIMLRARRWMPGLQAGCFPRYDVSDYTIQTRAGTIYLLGR